MRLLAAAVLIALALAAHADAAGLPVPTDASGQVGATAPGSPERLTTRRAGDDTIVSATRPGAGEAQRSRRIAGRWSVPAVTINGDTTGLSGDGGTLVLARPTRNFPTARTHLAVLDVPTLSVRRKITLRGFFTVDAVSPDGGAAFVIQYPSDDPLDYRVRALDTGTGRLDPRDVVDPRNPDEQMGGMPFARVLSADGRWAYTLYGGGEETFIHALDTVARTAACIDLEMLPAPRDVERATLAISGPRLLVSDAGELVATVDRATFEVSEPGEAAPAPAAPATSSSPSGAAGFPWPAAVLLAAAACAAAALLVRHRRARLR
jgi:hypothetical protein